MTRCRSSIFPDSYAKLGQSEDNELNLLRIMEPSSPAKPEKPCTGKTILGQAILVFLVSGLIYWLVRFESVALVADTVAYLAGAKSIASGDGYRMAWHVGLPRIGVYPPGQSAWLALFWPRDASFAEALPRLLLAMAVAGGLANGLLYLLGRRTGLSGPATLGLVGIWAVSPLWVQWLFWLMSDPMFLAVLLGMMAWAVGLRSSPTRTAWFGLGVGIAAALAFRTAAIGIFAGAATVGIALSRKDWKSAVLLILPGFAVLWAWRTWTAGITGYGDTYSLMIADAGGLPGLLREKADEALSWVSGRFFFEAVFPLFSRSGVVAARHFGKLGGLATDTVMAAAFGCVVWLAWKGVRGRWTPGLKAVIAVLAVYSAMVYMAPNPGWFVHRYLYPVWLLMFIYAVHGLEDRLRSRDRRFERSAARAAVAAAIAINLAGTLRTRQFWRKPEDLAELAAIADHLASQPGNKPVLAADVDDVPAMYLGDRLGNSLLASYYFRPGFPVLVRAADQNWVQPNFLVTSATGFETNYPGLFTLEFGANHKRWRLYRVDPDADREWRRAKGLPPPPVR